MLNTLLLRDEPAHEDAFGAHQRIADELVRIVQADDDAHQPPRSIGLLGDWGSGKSSVIYMMRTKLRKLNEALPRFRVFIYDAWAHQGDELRRAFLDSLVEDLEDVLDDETKDVVRKRIWQKEEKTETKSEQVLRRHGKILLACLLLSPISLRFYQSPPEQWSDMAKCIWNYVAFVGIFSPFIAFLFLGALKKLPFPSAHRVLFGTDRSNDLKRIRISSVFFQRTEGHVDVKTTTNPSDSIREFNDIFRLICESVIDSGNKLIIVIDNIDRLNHNDARFFWATMQSFLDKSLWRRAGDDRKVFYIAPFSPLAIRSVFADGADDQNASQSFLDKTFDLSVHVSPPIQVDLRGYMFTSLRLAFPDHDVGCLEVVRDLYDYHRTGQSTLGMAGDAETSRRTPRQIKLFINQLVALYRLRGEEIALETMAAYLLCQNDIHENGLSPDQQLTPQQIYLLPSEPDVVQQMAAVHFGVSLASAAQVILFEPIRTALNSDLSALTKLSVRSGFTDVLKLAIGTRDGEASVLDTLRVAIAVGGMPAAAEGGYKQIWSALLNNLRHANRMDVIDEHAAEGLRLIHSHVHENQKASFAAVLREGLSGKWIDADRQGPQATDERKEAFEGRMALTRSFAVCAQKLADLGLLRQVGELKCSAPAGFATRLVEEVSKTASWKEIAGALELNVVSGDTAKTIVEWPGVQHGPRVPYDFIKVADLVQRYTPDWTKVTELAVAKISATASEADQVNVSLRLLLAVGARHSKLGVEKAIQGIFGDGTLAVACQENPDDTALSGAVVAAFLIFCPSVNPASLVLPTGRPATVLSNILQGNDVEAGTIEAAADLILEISRSSVAFSNSVLNTTADKIGTRIIATLIKRGHRFNLSKFSLVRGQSFLSSLPGDVPVPQFYEHLLSSATVLDALKKRQMEPGESYTYLRISATSWGGRSIALRNRLKKYVQDAGTDKWVDAIRENSDRYNLMFTIKSLARLGVKPELGASASDAIVTVVDQAVSSNDRINGRAADVTMALGEDIRSNLSAKIWQLLIAAKSFEPIASVLEVMPGVIEDSSSRSMPELLNTVFTRALSSNDISIIRWIKDVVQEREPEIQSSQPPVGEFRSRVSAQLRITGLPKRTASRTQKAVVCLTQNQA